MGILDGVLPFLPVIGSIASAFEARSNRAFQERMSNTAHQREVRDMLNAGLNPVLSARGGPGASTPSGASGDVSGLSSAGLLKAQVDLLRAQEWKTRVEATDIQQTWQLGRGRSVAAAADIAELDVRERTARVEQALARAKAEVDQMSNSARAAEARAILDEAAAAGAKNLEELEKKLGPAGPAVRMLFELMRTLRGAAR